MTLLPEDSTRRLRVAAQARGIDDLVLEVERAPRPALSAGEALVRVGSAAVNPSDAKATLGLMPHAVWPRTPGRDFAGIVVDGPAEWVDREVWGSGGELGISRDGSHSSWLAIPVRALRAKPAALSLDEAGSVGVPFVTAYEGFRRSGLPQAGQVVLVLGANGKVGQAAVQLAAQAGATVIAVQRSAGPLPGWTPPGVHVLQADGFVERVRALSNGHGADIVYNTVGSPYFQAANDAMAKKGVQILIATQDRAIPFDIFRFYRGMHTYVGIDSLALDCVACAERLAAMAPGFEARTLRPYPIEDDAVYPIDDAMHAYRRVLAGDSRRLVLRP